MANTDVGAFTVTLRDAIAECRDPALATATTGTGRVCWKTVGSSWDGPPILLRAAAEPCTSRSSKSETDGWSTPPQSSKHSPNVIWPTRRSVRSLLATPTTASWWDRRVDSQMSVVTIGSGATSTSHPATKAGGRAGAPDRGFATRAGPWPTLSATRRSVIDADWSPAATTASSAVSTASPTAMTWVAGEPAAATTVPAST